MAVSNKLHKPLVIGTSSKLPTSKSPRGNASVSNSTISTTPDLLFRSPHASMHSPSVENTVASSSPSPPEIIDKTRILREYEQQYGSNYSHSIVTKKQGEPYFSSPSRTSLSDRTRMRPSLDKHYRVQELTIYNVITTVLREFGSSFSRQDILSMILINKDFFKMIPKVLRWLTIDFTPLREHRCGYDSQLTIDPHRVEMANAAMVHFGLDPGKFVRWIGGEYTGQSRDVAFALAQAAPHVHPEDLAHMRRILLDGCPAELRFHEPLSNKLLMIHRGNSKAFNENPDLVLKTMNKEDRYSHLIPLDTALCLFSPYCRHTTQTLVMKPGKADRLCWDASTTKLPSDIVLNAITPTKNEPPITFGFIKKQLYIDLYNTRVSYPDKTILLAMADIKACFRFARVSADLTGALGFIAGGYYNLATAMVFGSTASASSWEPFRRAIQALSMLFADRPELVKKHKTFLDMIRWDPVDESLPSNLPITPAIPCALNKGILDDQGHRAALPARIYVDDALMLAPDRAQMELTLSALIEAIFVIMGRPDIQVRQCPLALDKWVDLVVGPRQVMLGLIVDTTAMTVSLPEAYTSEVLDLLNSTWHPSRRSFTVQEAQTLTGKLGHIAEGAHWVFHLLTHLYASIALALANNKHFLQESSREFRDIVHSLRTGRFTCPASEQARHISFAMKRAAQLVHHARCKYFINTSMREEIEFFRDKLRIDSGIVWGTPIAHIIPRAPSFISYGDSCLHGAGGYSLYLRFWWHLDFPQEVILRTLIHMPTNHDNSLISINVLEFVTVIISYCAALHTFRTTPATSDPYPVLLNVTDNSSALSWTAHTCRRSKIGRRLARFFCSFLINSPLGINSQWISTEDNKIADDISRLKRASSSSTSPPSFDYSSLPQMYPELASCAHFHPAPKLLSLIWEIVLTEKWPDHNAIRMLIQQPLGKLTTLSGRATSESTIPVDPVLPMPTSSPCT